MLDYLEYCLLRYYEQINWSKQGQYSNICASTKRLLDFRIPQGFYLTIGKSISPELKSAYTIGLPNVRSAGFLFSSVPVQFPPMHLKDEESLNARPAVATYPTPNPSPNPVEQNIDLKQGWNLPIPSWLTNPEKDYLLYGRIFEDLRLEALYTRRLSPHTLTVLSGVSFWKDHSISGRVSKINAQLLHSRPQWCGEISYASDDHVFGVSGLYKLGDSNWAAGSELYYTGKERSGGLSVGGRYKTTHPDNVQTIVTILASPMMGHVAAAYTTTVYPGLNVATRYKINVYSFEADVGVGFEYVPEGKEQLVKARVSLVEGLAVKLEGRYRQSLVSVGFQTQFGRMARQSLGIEIQVS